MAEPARAGRISLEQLNTAVVEAVELAKERRGLELEAAPLGSDFLRNPVWTIGRQVRGDISLDDAYQVATSITEAVESSVGIRLSPTVTIVDKQILCGFIERFDRSFDLPGTRF